MKFKGFSAEMFLKYFAKKVVSSHLGNKLSWVRLFKKGFSICVQGVTSSEGNSSLPLNTYWLLCFESSSCVNDVLLDLFFGRKFHSLCLLGKDFSSQLSSKDGSFHGTQELLGCPVTSHGQIGDGGSLSRTVLVTTYKKQNK